LVVKKEIAVKKYVVRLSAEERQPLEAHIHAGRSSAQTLTRARILLKADVSEAGEGWNDSAISAAVDASVNNVAHTRQQLVEEGFEATLVHFIPRPSRDLLAALAAQDEEADDCAEVAFAPLVPDRRQFCVGEHPIPRNFVDSLAGADDRVRVGQPSGNRPCVQRV
jgi:hypothetical protein